MEETPETQNVEQTKESGSLQSAVDALVRPTPNGVVALFVGKDGRVLANAGDFDLQGYGGLSLQEAQIMRAKRTLANEVMRSLSHPLICSAIDAYDAQKIMDSMCSRCGCRVEIVSMGHDA
jgi:hypothetical protein